MERQLLLHFHGLTAGALSAGLEAGSFSAFGEMAAQGTGGPLRGFRTLPDIAATVALGTGRHPARHGILAETVPDVAAGRMRTPLAADRAAPYLWEMLALAGHESFAINWPASRGASCERLTVVPPDFADPRFPQTDHREWLISAEEIDIGMIAHFVPGWQEIDQTRDPRIARLAAGLACQASRHAVFTHLLEGADWRFGAIHEPLAARLAGLQESGGVFSGLVEKGWAYLDQVLARVLELTPAGTTVVVIGTPASGQRPDHGFLLARGPGIEPDSLTFGAAVCDIAPTLMARSGLADIGAGGRLLANLQPSDPPTRRPGGRVEISAKPLPNGLEQLEDLLWELDGLKRPHALSDDDAARAVLLRAAALQDAGEWMAAHALLEDCAARRPEDPACLLQLAETELHLGWWPAAKTNLAALRALQPNDPLPLLLMARLAAETGRRAEARLILDETPQEGGRLLQLALVRLRLADWRVVLELAPALAELSAVTAAWMSARAYLGLRDFSAAATAAAAAIELDPYHALSHELLGIALWRSGDRDGARASLLSGLRIAPDRPLTKLRLHRLERELGLASTRPTTARRVRLPEPTTIAPSPPPPGPDFRGFGDVAPRSPALVRIFAALPGPDRDEWAAVLAAAGLAIVDETATRAYMRAALENPGGSGGVFNHGDAILILPTVLLPLLGRLDYYRIALAGVAVEDFARRHQIPPLAPFLKRHFHELSRSLAARPNVGLMHVPAGVPRDPTAVAAIVNFLRG